METVQIGFSSEHLEILKKMTEACQEVSASLRSLEAMMQHTVEIMLQSFEEGAFEVLE